MKRTIDPEIRKYRIGDKVRWANKPFIWTVVSLHDCGTAELDFDENEADTWEAEISELELITTGQNE